MYGLYGSGMHDFILDELELGTRVAMVLDEENNQWGAEVMYWWHTVGTPELAAMAAAEE